mgnify:CR=1 FL=1
MSRLPSLLLLLLCLSLSTGCWQDYHEPKIDAIEMNAMPSAQWEADLKELLTTHVNDKGLVDYATLATQKEKVEGIIAALNFVRIDASWTDEQKLAFWINAYNIIMFWNILSEYPEVHTEKNVIAYQNAFFDTNKFAVAGVIVSLNDIEHKMLRNDNPDAEFVTNHLVVKTLRPEIHVAVSCAALSCPPLLNDIWEAEKVDETLKSQMRKVLNDEAFVSLGSDGKPSVTSLVDWYNVDFKTETQTVGAYLASWLDDSKQELKTALIAAGNDKSKLSFKNYDWTLNHQ